MTRSPRPALVLIPILPLVAALAGCGDRQPDTATPPAEAAASATAAPAATPAAPSRRETPRDAVDAVMARFLQARSYHVTMDTRAGDQAATIEMDFVAPDRYRMQTPAGTQHVIGDTMYMTVGGKTMKLPMSPGQARQFRDSARFAEHRDTMMVESLGSEPIDGVAAQKYVVRNTRPEPSQSTMWVGADGYPVQVAVEGNVNGQPSHTQIRYSRFNDPTITIEPPQ
jgi:hypothetical protein